MLLTHIHIQLLQPGLAELTDPDPPMPTTPRGWLSLHHTTPARPRALSSPVGVVLLAARPT